jgi:MFS family permease
MHAIRKSSATDDIDPALLSCAERKRWENFQHRKKTVDAVLRLLNAASYGVAFFLPTIIKEFGVSDTQTGLLAALPFVFGGIGMVLLGQHSDRTTERKGHVGVALLMAAIGIGMSGLVSNPIIVIALLCFAQIGVSAVPAMFWPLPASFLTGASAAAGIAAINSLGNLSGFAGPFAMGYLKDLTGNFTIGLLLLAGCAVIGAAVVVSLRIDASHRAKWRWRISELSLLGIEPAPTANPAATTTSAPSLHCRKTGNGCSRA